MRINQRTGTCYFYSSDSQPHRQVQSPMQRHIPVSVESGHWPFHINLWFVVIRSSIICFSLRLVLILSIFSSNDLITVLRSEFPLSEEAVGNHQPSLLLLRRSCYLEEPEDVDDGWLAVRVEETKCAVQAADHSKDIVQVLIRSRTRDE